MQTLLIKPIPEQTTPAVVFTPSTGDRGIDEFKRIAEYGGVPPDLRNYSPRLGLGVIAVDDKRFSAFQIEINAGVETAPPVEKATGELEFLEIFARNVGGRRHNWGIEELKAKNFWERYGFRGEGTLVGHLDSGVALPHRALECAVEYVVTYDAGVKRPVTQGAVGDSHGSATAGVIAGRDAKSSAGNVRRIGIAPAAELACHAVELGGKIMICDMAQSLVEMSKLDLAAISIAVGPSDNDDLLARFTRRVVDAGILPVVAVGNSPHKDARPVAMNRTPECLSVGAAQLNGTTWKVWDQSLYHSDFGGRPVPELVAPGVGVTSALYGWPSTYDYDEFDGTSVAAAQVAGLAALLKSAFRTATGPQIKRALLESCTWQGKPTPKAGAGVPNALVAYDKLRAIVSP